MSNTNKSIIVTLGVAVLTALTTALTSWGNSKDDKH